MMFFSKKLNLSEESQCWIIIENAIKKYGNSNLAITEIKDSLEYYDGLNLIHFHAFLYKLLNLSHNYNCWELAKLFNCDSDDSFLYFRLYLILEGEDSFLLAVNDPNRYLYFKNIKGYIVGEDYDRESLMYVCSDLFKGNDFYGEFDKTLDICVENGSLSGDKRKIIRSNKDIMCNYSEFMIAKENIKLTKDTETKNIHDEGISRAKNAYISVGEQTILKSTISELLLSINKNGLESNSYIIELRAELKEKLKPDFSLISKFDLMGINQVLKNIWKEIYKLTPQSSHSED